jgi:hypothetical protein
MADEPRIRINVEVSKSWRGLELDDVELDRLRLIGEEEFQSQIIGLSTREIREFIAAQGIIECGSRTKSGRGCKRITAVFLEYEIPQDGELIFHFYNASPQFVSACIRGWQKHKALGLSCLIHGGDRGIAHFNGQHLFWPKEVRAERAEFHRIAKKAASEERLKADLENPAEPSFSIISKLGRVAVAQFERLDFSTITDPELLKWHQAMLALKSK